MQNNKFKANVRPTHNYKQTHVAGQEPRIPTRNTLQAHLPSVNSKYWHGIIYNTKDFNLPSGMNLRAFTNELWFTWVPEGPAASDILPQRLQTLHWRLRAKTHWCQIVAPPCECELIDTPRCQLATRDDEIRAWRERLLIRLAPARHRFTAALGLGVAGDEGVVKKPTGWPSGNWKRSLFKAVTTGGVRVSGSGPGAGFTIALTKLSRAASTLLIKASRRTGIPPSKVAYNPAAEKFVRDDCRWLGCQLNGLPFLLQ